MPSIRPGRIIKKHNAIMRTGTNQKNSPT
jgi:hypothetical protein